MPVVNTGVAIEVPKGFVGIIKARSLLTKLGLGVEGGVIDADYRGEIKAIMANRSKIHEVKLYAKDRIAQLIIIPYLRGKIMEVEDLEITNRGIKGFGSTGQFLAKNISYERKEDQNQSKHTYQLSKKLNEKQRDIIRRLMWKFEDILVTKFEEI